MRDRWEQFWFASETDEWLTVLRVGLALQLSCYCLSLGRDWLLFFGSRGTGLLGREISEVYAASQSPLVPRLGWLVNLGAHGGLPESGVLWTVWTVLLISAFLLGIGAFSRPAAVTAWFLHLGAAKSSALFAYGMDSFMSVGLFYLMLSPLPDCRSFDYRKAGRRSRYPQLLGFFRRLPQLNLCIAYFFAGAAKACGPGWWNGDSIWRAQIRPPFDVVSPDLLVRFRLLFPAVGILVILLEVGYSIFIWPRSTRRFWLSGILVMHAAIGLLMGMYLFALVLIVLNLSAFGPGGLWPAAKNTLGNFRRRRLAQGIDIDSTGPR